MPSKIERINRPPDEVYIKTSHASAHPVQTKENVRHASNKSQGKSGPVSVKANTIKVNKTDINRKSVTEETKAPIENDSAEKAPKVRKYEQRSGCLGGLMYFAFILCLSVSIAFFGWMAASDMFSLNKKSFETTVTLPLF